MNNENYSEVSFLFYMSLITQKFYKNGSCTLEQFVNFHKDHGQIIKYGKDGKPVFCLSEKDKIEG